MNNKHQKLPFFEALVAYAESDVTSLDVPGHKLGHFENELLNYAGENLFKLDSNAPRGLDNLNNPIGVLKEASHLMSDALGAYHTFFLTGGTTMGILSMIMSSVRAKEKIILPRNVHKSAINALILSGAIPIFVEPNIDQELGIANHMEYDSLAKAIQKHPDAKAVFMINPTYFGATGDIQKMVTLAHQHQMLVLVDEAHGAHFYFNKKLPISAMHAGADMSAISIHKTAGSLTQSSVLAVSEAVDLLRVKSTINMLQSTSPSSLLLASMDVARKYMYFHADQALENVIKLAAETRERLNAIDGIETFDKDYFLSRGASNYDQTKIVIKVSDLGITGFEAYRLLKDQYQVQFELAETHLLLAVLSFATTKKDMDRLVIAMSKLAETYKQEDYITPSAIMRVKPKTFIRPREAYHAPKRYIKIKDALDEIAGESIMIYPPGIPIVIPGEIITQSVLDDLAFYKENDSTILSDSEVGYVKVIDKEKWIKWEEEDEDE